MSILNEAKYNLESFWGYNSICIFDTNEEYNEFKELVKQNNDYGYLDIVIDTEDFIEVEKRYEKLKDRIHLTDSLFAIIMQKAGFDIDDYTYADFWFFKRDLNQKAEEQGKESARIIFLLGDMKDIDMQHSVNEFIANRNITIMCYNVGRLLSYHTPDGTFLENVHDYIKIENYKVKTKKMEGEYYDKY